jgi:hypothetical protein
MRTEVINTDFRTSGTDKRWHYKRNFGNVFTQNGEPSIQYISLTFNEVVLMPGYRPRMKHGYIDIVKEA